MLDRLYNLSEQLLLYFIGGGPRRTTRQPFGTFSGALPGGITFREAYGVMEYHEALW